MTDEAYSSEDQMSDIECDSDLMCGYVDIDSDMDYDSMDTYSDSDYGTEGLQTDSDCISSSDDGLSDNEMDHAFLDLTCDSVSEAERISSIDNTTFIISGSSSFRSRIPVRIRGITPPFVSKHSLCATGSKIPIRKISTKTSNQKDIHDSVRKVIVIRTTKLVADRKRKAATNSGHTKPAWRY